MRNCPLHPLHRKPCPMCAGLPERGITARANKSHELERRLKIANDNATYWEDRYHALAKEIRSYFESKKMLKDDANRLIEQVKDSRP